MTSAPPDHGPRSFDPDRVRPEQLTAPASSPSEVTPGPPAETVPAKPSLLVRLLVGALGLGIGVFLVAEMVATVQLAAQLPSPASIAIAVASLAGVGLLAILTLRQILAVAALGRIDALRRDSAKLLLAPDRDADRRVFTGLHRLYAHRRDTEWVYRSYVEARDDTGGAGDRLALFEQTVLGSVDRQATAIIIDNARRTALFTAISPFTALDMMLTAWRAAATVQRLSVLYGGRPGTTGTIILLRRVFAQVAIAGALEATNEMTAELLGGGVSARISTRLGQGVVNGLFMIRLGLATLDQCRPVPFTRLAKPTTLDLGRRALTDLTGGRDRR